MAKINGYSREEAESFVKYICQGKGQGKTLTRIFEEYAAATHRAKGSVRKHFFGAFKKPDNGRGGEKTKRTNPRAEDVRPFTDEETDKILREILRQKSKGVSVRRAVLNLADGDDKLMLRYQNKYRNVMSKQPERIERLMKECGLDSSDGGRQALEDKINSLYDRLNSSLKDEVKRLTALVKKLTDENSLLKLQVKNLQS